MRFLLNDRNRLLKRLEILPRRKRRCDLSLERLDQRTLLTTIALSDPAILASAQLGLGYEADLPTDPVCVAVGDGTYYCKTVNGPEDYPVTPPQSVSGAYLTEGAETVPGYDKPMSFDKVVQGQSDTCVFTSSLSAVALSSFNLSSGITIGAEISPTDYVYDVRVYEPVGNAGLAEIDIPVEYNGTVDASDATSTDPNEFWPTLYLRLSRHGKFKQPRFSPACQCARGVDGSARHALHRCPNQWRDDGHAKLAPSEIERRQPSDGPVDRRRANARSRSVLGIVSDHSYTVMGVEIPASGSLSSTYVTLRNPWGQDTQAPISRRREARRSPRMNTSSSCKGSTVIMTASSASPGRSSVPASCQSRSAR